ncbi:MAG: PH domain-containing protein [Pseudomonadota bacterium]
MSPADGHDWRRTSPLAILFFLGSILKALVKNATQVIAPTAAFFFAFGGDTQTKIIIAVSAFVLITGTVSVLRYLFFRYAVADDAILIREGIVNKKQLDIKYNRIQGINTEQSFIYRFFDLVTVSFDTAGSAGSEGQLPAVKTDFSRVLRERIGHAKPSDSAADETGAPAAEAAPILKLDWGDMIRIGLADRRAFLFLAIAAPLFDQLSEELGEVITRAVEDVATDVAALGPAIAATLIGTGIVIVVAILVLASIVAAFLRYHNFALYLESRRLRSVGGLLTRHEANMETGKVQLVRVKQSLVMRWAERVRLVLQQASSKTQKGGKSFIVPAAAPGFEAGFVADVFDPEAQEIELRFDSAALRRVSAHYLRPRILYFGVLPALLMSTLAWFEAGWDALPLLLWIPLWSVVSWQRWRRLAYHVTGDALLRRSGFLARQLDVFLLRKAQRVTITQSPYQRRKGLSSVRFFLASGSIRVPYIDFDEAQKIRDYVLYKVESSTRSWH